MTKKTSLYENGLIWFGAGVSVSEIITGTCLAPMGFGKGLAAVALGHIIGCVMLFLCGVIGGISGKSAMETVSLAFGTSGSRFFAILNILQLTGWTTIMIYDGSIAANGILSVGRPAWCIVIGGLIILWIFIGIQGLGKVNTVSMAALFILTVILSIVIFGKGSSPSPISEIMSFGAAVELSAAMPLSWLPLISDYTRDAEKPVKASAVSAVTYCIISSWMYIIGMGAAIFAGTSDIAEIMTKAGLGIAALVIIVLSTVTTTFLDAYSAGVSAESAVPAVKGRHAGLAAAVIGTAGAMLFPMDDITDFLYLIGSVFAPMAAVLIADRFLLKADRSGQKLHIPNIIAWTAGAVLYRVLLKTDLPIGTTLPDMVITMWVSVVVNKIAEKFGCKRMS